MICIVSDPKRLNDAQRDAVARMWPLAMHSVKSLLKSWPELERLDLVGIAHLALMNLAAGRKGDIPPGCVKAAIRNAAINALKREERQTVPVQEWDIANDDPPYLGEPSEYLALFNRRDRSIIKQWMTFPSHESTRSVARQIGVNYQRLFRLIERLKQCGE